MLETLSFEIEDRECCHSPLAPKPSSSICGMEARFRCASSVLPTSTSTKATQFLRSRFARLLPDRSCCAPAYLRVERPQKPYKPAKNVGVDPLPFSAEVGKDFGILPASTKVRPRIMPLLEQLKLAHDCKRRKHCSHFHRDSNTKNLNLNSNNNKEPSPSKPHGWPVSLTSPGHQLLDLQ